MRSRFKRLKSKARGEDDGAADELNSSLTGANGVDGTDLHSAPSGPLAGVFGRTSSGLAASSPSRPKRPATGEADTPTAKKSKHKEEANGNHLTQSKLSFLPDTLQHNATSSSRSNSPTHRPRVSSETSESLGIRTSNGTPRWGAREALQNARNSMSSDELQRHIDTAIEKGISERTLNWQKMEEAWRSQERQWQETVESLNAELSARGAAQHNKEVVHSQLIDRAGAELEAILRDSERDARAALREKLAADSIRLGYPSYGRNGEEFREGMAAKILREKDSVIEEKRAMYETTKKRLAKRKTALTSSNASSANQSSSNALTSSTGISSMIIDSPVSPGANGEGGIGYGGSFSRANGSSLHQFGSSTVNMTPAQELEDIVMQDQLIKFKLAALKSDEQELVRERDALRVETQLHYKEMRRFQEEETSKFNTFPILNGRYLMLKLLGRGGFSEVYRAYDLRAFRHVACKIHQLSQQWQPEKKASYLRHAHREADIHKSLVHPRIVAMYDIFDIDENTFCTVMEYCEGGDLDSYLKQHKSLPEGEARVLIAQLFDGLRYLMTQGEKDKQKIIHYDLKPGNLLFDEKTGSIKIADFGLSKIMDPEADSMELTSQGAGTYWYLPPECFGEGKQQITSKVDVWSAGVILYQMLFGCKPFGHNISQKHILERNLIHANLKVEFPTSPVRKVSDEAKHFLMRCLTPSVTQRPDATMLAHDPFLSFAPAPKRGAAASSSGTNTMGPPSSNFGSHGASSSPNPSNFSPSKVGSIPTIGGGTFTIVRK